MEPNNCFRHIGDLLAFGFIAVAHLLTDSLNYNTLWVGYLGYPNENENDKPYIYALVAPKDVILYLNRKVKLRDLMLKSHMIFAYYPSLNQFRMGDKELVKEIVKYNTKFDNDLSEDEDFILGYMGRHFKRVNRLIQ